MNFFKIVRCPGCGSGLLKHDNRMMQFECKSKLYSKGAVKGVLRETAICKAVQQEIERKIKKKAKSLNKGPFIQWLPLED